MRNVARRRYERSTLALGAVYAMLLFSAAYSFRYGLVSGPLAWGVAVLPALPIVGFFVAIGRYLAEERDEYLRMLMVRQTLWASGFALTVATIWGFLEGFGLVGHVEAYAVPVLWFVGLGFGALINRLTTARAS